MVASGSLAFPLRRKILGASGAGAGYASAPGLAASRALRRTGVRLLVRGPLKFRLVAAGGRLHLNFPEPPGVGGGAGPPRKPGAPSRHSQGQPLGGPPGAGKRVFAGAPPRGPRARNRPRPARRARSRRLPEGPSLNFQAQPPRPGSARPARHWPGPLTWRRPRVPAAPERAPPPPAAPSSPPLSSPARPSAPSERKQSAAGGRLRRRRGPCSASRRPRPAASRAPAGVRA